jgi:hypothetical protein
MKKLSLLLIIYLITNLGSISNAQESKTKWEVSCFGLYCYHLADVDLAISPENDYTQYNWECFRFAVHGNTLHTFGLYSCFNLGIGAVTRDISTNWRGVPDYSSHMEFYLGTTVNPLHSKRVWYHFAAGYNKLHIGGEGDMTTGGGPGITYVGNNPWNKWLNNLPTSNGVITGYPAFNRAGMALNAGVTLRILGAFSFYFDYTPILISPIRNDFSTGLTFVFPPAGVNWNSPAN